MIDQLRELSSRANDAFVAYLREKDGHDARMQKAHAKWMAIEGQIDKAKGQYAAQFIDGRDNPDIGVGVETNAEIAYSRTTEKEAA